MSGGLISGSVGRFDISLENKFQVFTKEKKKQISGMGILAVNAYENFLLRTRSSLLLILMCVSDHNFYG